MVRKRKAYYSQIQPNELQDNGPDISSDKMPDGEASKLSARLILKLRKELYEASFPL